MMSDNREDILEKIITDIFLLAYSGVLFRCYPEGYQTLLDRGQGSYRRVCVQQRRPALGAFKAERTRALKVARRGVSLVAASAWRH